MSSVSLGGSHIAFPQTVIGAQRLSEGATALHEPSHCVVPVFVMAQILGVEVQAVPFVPTHVTVSVRIGDDVHAIPFEDAAA